MYQEHNYDQFMQKGQVTTKIPGSLLEPNLSTMDKDT